MLNFSDAHHNSSVQWRRRQRVCEAGGGGPGVRHHPRPVLRRPQATQDSRPGWRQSRSRQSGGGGPEVVFATFSDSEDTRGGRLRHAAAQKTKTWLAGERQLWGEWVQKGAGTRRRSWQKHQIWSYLMLILSLEETNRLKHWNFFSFYPFQIFHVTRSFHVYYCYKTCEFSSFIQCSFCLQRWKTEMMQRMKTDEHNQHTINNAIVGTNQGIVFYFSNF